MAMLSNTAQTVNTQALITRLTTGSTLSSPVVRFYTNNTLVAECAVGTFQTVVDGFSYATVATANNVTSTPNRYELVSRANTVELFGDSAEIQFSLINQVLTVLGGIRLFSPSSMLANDELGFVHEYSSFQPSIEVTGSPTILWTFADGSTSNSATPTQVNFGSSRTRLTKLKVTPWSSVVGINMGYNGGDSGTNYTPDTYYHPDQGVSEILNLHLVRYSLVRILASGVYNTPAPMQFIDLTNFSALEVAEFYWSSIKSYSVIGCTSLKRLCFEACGITIADFYDCINLEDFRGALGTFSSVRASTHNALWHLCVRDNTVLTSLPNINSSFPNIREVWAWGCHLSTNLGFGSNNTELNDVRIYSNYFTQAAIDAMLAAVNALNVDGGAFYVNYNNGAIGPSAAGIVSANGMVADGWDVAYDISTVSTPTSNPAAGTFSSTQSVQLLCATNGAEIRYTTNGTTPTASSTLYTGTPLAISTTTRIRAIAILAGYTNSAEYDGTFTISTQVATPTFNPGAGTYNSTQSVTISCSTPSSTIYYRVDGGSYQQYTGAISVSTSQTIDAYATASSMTQSQTATAAYTISNLTQINFVTDGSDVNMEVQISAACDVVWHWSDGTTSTSLTPTKSFGSAASRSHYVTFTNPGNVTRFGRGATICMIYSVDANWTLFPNCAYLYFYRCGIVDMSLSGGVFNQLHLRNDLGADIRTPTAQLDEWLIDLDNSTNAAAPRNIYIQAGRTAASNAARASLVGKGWDILDS